MATITLAIIPVPIIILVTCALPLLAFSGVVLVIGGGVRFVAVCIVVMEAFLWNQARSWRRQGTGYSFPTFQLQ
jgi:hypothetical protein